MRLKPLALVLTLPLLLGFGPAASEPHYTALGDSYAAGVGAGAYDSASGGCHRSGRGYPALWSAEHQASLVSLACLGATTADVRQDQLPQLQSGTGLVTLTVGGNDLGFTEAIVACLQPLTTEGRCDAALDETDRRLREELPGKLDGLYQAIGDAAPGAEVVATGYPYLLEAKGPCGLGTEARRSRFNALTDRLDSLIETQADKHGFRFADVRGTFAGHGACAEHGAAWINGITFPIWESFHPTADGQRLGYLPQVAAAIGG